MSFRGFLEITPNEPWGRIPGAVLQWVRRGKLNVVGEVTLRANQTTTTLTDQLIGPGSSIDLMPMTANAAAAKAGLYFSTPTVGSVVINHASDAATDQLFRYKVIG